MAEALASTWERQRAAWTDDRIEQLKKLWEAGLSASQIAAEMCNVTRCAVIGKAHRLGLAGRAKSPSSSVPSPRRVAGLKRTVRVDRQPSRVAQALAALPVEELAEPVEAIIIPFTQRKALLDLATGDCRWPIGDPQSPDFHFCGGGALEGLPYCAGHSRFAYDRSGRRSKTGGAITHRGASDAWA